MSEGAYRCFKAPTGACGWLLVFEGAYGCLLVPTVD